MQPEAESVYARRFAEDSVKVELVVVVCVSKNRKQLHNQDVWDKYIYIIIYTNAKLQCSTITCLAL